MKILYHHRIRSKDGQSVHVDEIIKAFSALGHQVEVCAPSSYGEEEFGGESGSLSLLKKYLPSFVYELLEFGYAFLDFYKVLITARKFRPDFIYERYNLFLPSGIWAKKLLGIPLLLEVNAPLLEERSTFGGISLKGLARWSEEYTWRGADHVFAVSNVLADYVRHIGVPDNQITVTHNGVDLDEFGATLDKSDAKRALKLEEKLVLGFVGFIREWHGLDKVIDVIADNQETDCVFVVIGDGPGKMPLEKQARQRGISDRVVFKGIVGRGEVSKYISAFDIALQPAVVAYASPLKLFEYMASACSIIAPDSENIKEVLRDGENARLFRGADKTDFVRVIQEMIRDKSALKSIGENARQSVISTPYTWQHNAETIVGVANAIGH